MNRQKHKLSRRILAVLLMAAMLITMLPSAMFAAPSSNREQIKTVSTSSDALSITKSVGGTGTEADPYKLTMEAFVSGEVGASTSAPLDIVLVMDQSGSMAYNNSGDETHNENDRRISSLKTALTNFVDTIQTNAQENSVDHRIAMVGYASEETGNPSQIRGTGVTEGSDSTYWLNTGLYINGQMKNYVSGITEASYEEVYAEELDNSKKYYIRDGWSYQEVSYNSRERAWGYEGFWGSWNKVTPKSSQNDRRNTQFYQYIPRNNGVRLSAEDYQNGLVSVNVNGTTNSSITNAISNMQVLGGTNTEYGMDMAQQVFANNPLNDDSNRQRVVVLFTDGDTDSTKSDVINQAKQLKSQYGATVYCVGFGNEVDTNFLEQVSSDYDSDGRPTGENKYYMSANNQEELNNIFVTIAGELSSIDVGEDAVLTDTLSEYFSFPANMSDNNLDGVTVQISEASGTGNSPNWGREENASDVLVSVEGDTINVTGFDYSANAVAKTSDGWQGQKLILTFPIEIDSSANWDEAGYYDTNTLEAGLKVPANDGGHEYVDDGQLTDSPNVWVENVNANGTDVTVQVYVDGVMSDTPTDLVTISRNPSNDGYTYFKKVSEADGTVTYDFNYEQYDCIDLLVNVNDDSIYILQGVESNQSHGQSGTSNVKDNENGTYTIDNVTAVDNENDSDCKIYLSTKYSVKYFDGEKELTDAAHKDTTAYINPETVKVISTTENGPAENKQQWMSWKNSGYATFIAKLPALPTAADGYTAQGWYLGSVDATETTYAPDKKFTAINSDSDKADKKEADHVIEFYATSTKDQAVNRIEKKVVAQEIEGISGEYDYPVKGEVTVDEGGSVTLLYAITVTGTPNTEVKVEDNGATLVGNGATYADGFFVGTTDDKGTLTFYVSRTFEKITTEDPLTNVAKAYLKDQDPEDVDNPPSSEEVVNVDLIPDPEDDIETILPNGLVKIVCTENGAKHQVTNKTYALIDGSYEVKYTGGSTAKVTITAEKYISAFSDDVAEGEAVIAHTLKESTTTKDINLEYKNGAWAVTTSTPIVFNVMCAAPDEISDVTKTVQTELPEGLTQPDGVTFSYPESEGGPVKAKEGSNVTLLYAITVTGTPEIGFQVVDDGATLVPSQTGMTQADGVITGALDENGTKTFYVYKTFTDIKIDQAPLTNEVQAFLEDQDPTEDEPEAEGEEEVPVDVEPHDPTPEELKELEAKVNIDCNIVDAHQTSYDFAADTYSVVISKQDDTYFATVTADQYDYLAKFNEDSGANGGKQHKLTADEQDATIQLKYDNGWTLVDSSDTVTFYVECAYDLTGIDKTLITQKNLTDTSFDLDQLQEEGFTIPKNHDEGTVVTIPYDGSVTLLYAIKVTGVPNASFVVTDEGATLFDNANGVVSDGTEPNTFEGTIPDNGEITFYVSKTFTIPEDDEDNLFDLTNGVTLEGKDGDTVDPDKDKDEETIPGTEDEQTYSLIYDANGGTIGEDVVAEATNQKPGNVKLWQWTEENGTFTSTGTLPDGFNADTQNVPKHADAPAPEDTIISDAGESVPVVFIGWTEEPATDDAGKVDQSKIFAAGEELPATKNEVTIDAKTDMNGKAVYAVWGYDENGDGIADAEQVIVTPADIKIYTGGNGYSSVVNDVNAAVDNSTTSDGLPTPGYYIILPNDVNEKVLAKAEQDGATVTNGAGQKVADLSKYLTFDYSNGNETRHWTLERYDGTSGNTSMAYDKFIYRINPATTSVEGESVPIRLLFTDANGNEKISDDFTVSDDVLYQTFDMTIYAGDLDRGLIEATFTSNTGVSAQDIGVGSGTLTVRGVVTDENTTVNTTPILEAGADVDSATNVSVQLQNANTNFYINESQLEVADPDSVKLLVDDTVSEESDATMQNLAVETFSDTITEDHSVDMKYLDLVDTSNGNTWVTTDQEVTVFWPYPDDADRSGEFHVVHYTGLDRDEGGALDNNYSTDNMELYSTTESGESGITKTDNGILFTVDSFSPFAVYYTAADDEGDDNPPYYPWQPDGDDDGPSGLNTEDHFSYVVGYAEDYRTGEATDNEDLWPVKPNNQITRAEVATIFYRLLEDEVRDEYDTTTNDFSDVTADSWYNQTVSTLARMGIVKGYEDGTFRPNAPITRAEFGAIATRFFAETGATYEPGTFTDVTGNEWFANAIQDAVNLGLIGGYPDGTVRPNNNITRAEACAIVNRTLGRVPDADHLLPEDVMKVWPDNNPTDWFYADMQEATNGHEYAWIEEDGHEIEEWTNLLDKDWTDR